MTESMNIHKKGHDHHIQIEKHFHTYKQESKTGNKIVKSYLPVVKMVLIFSEAHINGRGLVLKENRIIEGKYNCSTQKVILKLVGHQK